MSLLTSISFSQDETTYDGYNQIDLKNKSFTFNYQIPKNNSSQRSLYQDEEYKVAKGAKIKVLYEKDSLVYFEYWTYRDTSSNNFENYNKENPVFSLNKSVFLRLVTPIFKRFKGVRVGAYTIPFRFRGLGTSNFDFESSLSLQANMVFGFGTRKASSSIFDASFGIGVTGVQLTQNNSLVKENRTASALTTSVGILYKPKPYANIGMFLGIDFLGKNDQSAQWVHDGKLWLGVGINVSFNQIKNTNSPKATYQERRIVENRKNREKEKKEKRKKEKEKRKF